MNDTNNQESKQTDIFGNPASFNQDSVTVKPDIIFDSDVVDNTSQTSNVVVENISQTPNVVEEQNVYPTSSVVELKDNVVKADESYTEMPFVGVNQDNMTVSEQTIIENEVVKNDNMKPVDEVVDENSGLKFLLVIGIILAVVIILLPVFLKL